MTPHRSLNRTESRRDLHESSPVPSPFNNLYRGDSLSAIWSPGQLLPPSSEDLRALPTPPLHNNQDEVAYRVDGETDPMTTRTASAHGKSSTDSAASGLDRWSQRRLQRLNTEQGFREQRQGSSVQVQSQSQNQNQNQASYAVDQAQPLPSGQPTAVYTRPAAANSSYGGASASSPPPVSATNSPSFPYHDGPPVHLPTQSNPSPADANPTYQALAARQLQQSSNYAQSQLHNQTNDSAVAVSNDNTSNSPPQSRGYTTRQSLHNNGAGMNSNPVGPNTLTSPLPTAPAAQQQQSTSSAQTKDLGRSTPQMSSTEDMTDEDINQLINDHKELRKLHHLTASPYLSII